MMVQVQWYRYGGKVMVGTGTVVQVWWHRYAQQSNNGSVLREHWYLM